MTEPENLSRHSPPPIPGDETDVEALIAVAEGYDGLGQEGRARRAYVRACVRHPRSATAHFRYGEWLLGRGNAPAATTALAKAVDLAPTPHHRATLARALIARNAYEDAMEQLHDLLETCPTHADGWQLLIALHRARGASDGALQAAQRAAEVVPGDRRLGLELGRLLSEAGRLDEAVAALQATAQLHPDDPDVALALGLAQLASGSPQAARETLARASRLDAAPGSVHLHLGRLLRDVGEPDAAIEALRAAVERAPDDVDAHHDLAELLHGRGDHAGAVAVLTRGLLHVHRDRRLLTLLHEAGAACAAAGESAPAPAREAMAPGISLCGDVAEFRVVDLLEFLRFNGRTGVLTLVTPSGVGEVRLDAGRLAAATTTVTRRLGDLLVEARAVETAKLDEALRELRRDAAHTWLGRWLVRSGLVTEQALSPVLTRQIHEALTEIVQWHEGWFAFEAGRPAPAAEQVPVYLDTAGALLDALRCVDERAAG